MSSGRVAAQHVQARDEPCLVLDDLAGELPVHAAGDEDVDRIDGRLDFGRSAVDGARVLGAPAHESPRFAEAAGGPCDFQSGGPSPHPPSKAQEPPFFATAAHLLLLVSAAF